MSSLDDRRIIIVPKHLLRKIDENRGDMGRAEFIEFCVDFCLRHGEEPGRADFERLSMEFESFRKEVLERLRELGEAYRRLEEKPQPPPVSTSPSPSNPPPEAEPLVEVLEEVSQPDEPGMAVSIIDWDDRIGPVVGLTYPEGWDLKGKLTRDVVTAVYTLMNVYEGGGVSIDLDGFRIHSLGAKDGRLAVLVASGDVDYGPVAEFISRGLKRSTNWEEDLPKLYRRALSRLRGGLRRGGR